VTQLTGILELFNPAEIRVYSKTFDHSESFAADFSKKLGLRIKACEDELMKHWRVLTLCPQ